MPDYKTIRVNGRVMKLHRYIMEEYLSRSLDSWEVVHHINGDPHDNRLENLGLTCKGGHASCHANFMQFCGERNVNAKLTAPDVVLIRRLNASGWHYKELAEEFGVIWNTVRKVCKREIWKHV